MPLRDYLCAAGHLHEVLIRYPSDVPEFCPTPLGSVDTATNTYDACGLPLKPTLSLPASKFPGANKW